MSTLRFKALRNATFKKAGKRIMLRFLLNYQNCFVRMYLSKAMREYLTKEAFSSIIDAIKKGTKLERHCNQVAVAMKD